jgi:hypothetical protein
MVLIEIKNGNKVMGRCDARCYNAKHANCNCICKGKNHGKGYEQGVENTKQILKEFAGEEATKPKMKILDLTIKTNMMCFQRDLFE